jgi:hypothetical protein
MSRSLLSIVFALAFTTSAGCLEPEENPVVVPEVVPQCGPAERLVTDVCTELGGDDGCTDVDDVCIALCDGVTSCTTVDPRLRPLTGWPTAPDGYCVVCVDGVPQ